MEIKDIYGAVIYSDTSETIKETLENAVKKGENLVYANLRGSNLKYANLEGSNLEDAIKIPIFCKWSHGITNGMIHIGCEKRSIEDWKIFLNSDKKIETERNTQEFKQIKAVINAYIAYLEVLNS